MVVVHGWTEGCSNTQWVRDTLNNFIIHRKGCILCLDYSVIADGNDYFTVAKLMEPIARTLEKKLRQLFTFGIAPASGMVYGFSLGAHVAFQAGRNLAPQKLGRIDGELVMQTRTRLQQRVPLFHPFILPIQLAIRWVLLSTRTTRTRHCA